VQWLVQEGGAAIDKAMQPMCGAASGGLEVVQWLVRDRGSRSTIPVMELVPPR
jgi:hypothetical protein